MKTERAVDLIKRLEDHTGHKIENGRLKFLIQSEIQRLMDEKEDIRKNVINALNGESTYNKSTHTTRRISNK